MAIQKKAVAFLGVLSIASSILGLFFSIVLAQCYGVSREVEIYFASTSLFFVIAALTQTGYISEIALPIYHQHIEAFGKKVAGRLYSQILNWMGLAATLVALFSALLSKQIIHFFVPGFSLEDQAKAQIFFLCICPLFVVEILRSLLGTLLNAEKIFGRTELANVASQVGNIVFVYLFYKSLGAYAAMFGLWFGQILSFGYSAYLVHKSGFRYRFTWKDSRFPIWSLLGKIQNTFSYVIATQLYMTGFNAALSLLPAGQYGVYKYAALIFSKTQGLLLHPVSTVFFSQFSKEYAKSVANVGRLILQCNRITILSSIVVLLMVYSVGMPAFCWLWLNEKFDLTNIQLAYQVLLLHYILLFFNGVALIYRKVNMTLGLVKELYLTFTVVQISFAVLLFFWPPSLGLFPLVASSMANVLVLAFIPPILARLKSPEVYQPIPISFLLKSFFISVLGLGILLFLKMQLYSFPGFLSLGWLPVLISCGVAAGIITVLLFKIFRVEELDRVFNLAKDYASRFF